MYAGSVVEAGPTDSVFARLAHPYTRGLFGARPRLGLPRGQRLATIAGRVPSLDRLPAGCAFAERCDRVQPACREGLPAMQPVDAGAGHAARCLHIHEVPPENLHASPHADPHVHRASRS
jgi:peptide/nickel transport system ATP-binding protein